MKKTADLIGGAIIIMNNTLYQFEVYLYGIRPLIWRRIAITSDASFWELGSAILDAMGWEVIHLFAFKIEKDGSDSCQNITLSSFALDDYLPAQQVKLSDYFKREKDVCLFVYDFGDNWTHVVRLEAIEEADPNMMYPKCLDGERACPPEDCGGINGYYHMLETFNNPEDEEHEELCEWLGEDYEPEMFMPDACCFSDPKSRFERLQKGLMW